MSNSRTGGRLLVDALRSQGVDMAFCVAGESYLELLDALYDARNEIKLVARTIAIVAGEPQAAGD